MTSRLRDSLDVLLGRKTAMDNAIPEYIRSTYIASLAAKFSSASLLQQPTNQTTQMSKKAAAASDEASDKEQHDTAVAQIGKTRTYLRGLPALFASLVPLLELGRVNSGIASGERKQFQDKINELKTRKDELEDLIGQTAQDADDADNADNGLNAETTTPPVNNLNPDGQEAAPNPPVSAVTGETTTPVGAVVGTDNLEATPDQVAAATDLSGPPADSTQVTPQVGAGVPTGEPAPLDSVPDGVTAPGTRASHAVAHGTGPHADSHTAAETNNKIGAAKAAAVTHAKGKHGKDDDSVADR